MANTTRESGWLIRARFMASHGGGRHGFTVTSGTHSRRRRRGQETGAACSLPHWGAGTMVGGRGSRAPVSSRGDARWVGGSAGRCSWSGGLLQRRRQRGRAWMMWP
jgi:hypothetical protein